MHTNPILITFCSILYYKDLGEHLHRFKVERRNHIIKDPTILDADSDKHVEMNHFGRRLSTHFESRNYNKTVLNRWHLWIRLSMNKELIYLRQNNFRRKHKDQPSIGILPKIKMKFQELKNKISTSEITPENENNAL